MQDDLAMWADEVPRGAESQVERDPGPPTPEPVLSIAGAARGLGVAPATLRSWERRYGLAPSLHSPGGHRRYGPVDLGRLQVMHRLVRAGVPAAEAARVALAADLAVLDGSGPFAALLRGEGSAEPPGPSSADAPRDGDPPSSSDICAGHQPADGHHPSDGGRVLALPRGASRTARGLARSAMALDAGSCRGILEVALASEGTVATWDHLIRPVMGAIGHRWESEGAGVEIEHSFSEVVAAVLAHRSKPPDPARNDRPVLLASVPEEMHDLPLRALHAALAELGIRAQLLGARTPADALADAMRRLGPPAVVLWAQMSIAELPDLPVIRPTPVLLVGGPGLEPAAASPRRTHSLVDAISQLRAALAV